MHTSQNPAWFDDDDVRRSFNDLAPDGKSDATVFRWTPTPVPDEQCFEAIKAGIDRLPAGVKMVLNSGQYMPSISYCFYVYRSE